MNKIDAAVSDYSQSLKLHPKHFKALHNRAFCLEKLGDLVGSAEDYSKALEIEPTNISTLTARALVYEKQLEYDKAVADLGYAVHLIESLEEKSSSSTASPGVDPRGGERVRESEMKPTLYVSLGSIHTKLNQLEAAQAYFSQALSAHGFLQAGTPPSSPRSTHGNAEYGISTNAATAGSSTTASTIFYARAMNYKVQGAYPAAIADFSSALNLDTSLILAYTNRGFCYRKCECYQQSIDDYSSAILLDSSNVRAHNNRAYCLARISKFQEAIADYTTVIRLDPHNSHAYHNRGISLDKLGRFDQAIADFTKVLQIDSRSDEEQHVNRRELEEQMKAHAHGSSTSSRVSSGGNASGSSHGNGNAGGNASDSGSGNGNGGGSGGASSGATKISFEPRSPRFSSRQFINNTGGTFI